MVPKICSIDGCEGTKRIRRGMCGRHYEKWLTETPHAERDAPRDVRFWQKVDRRGPDECWNWQGGPPGTQGYGAFNFAKGRTERTHRIALQLGLGRPLKPGAYACHTCDNRMCCNPAHLYEGTHQTNAADAKARNRHSRGSAHKPAKLTENDVLTIRLLAASGEKNVDIAAQFGIKGPTMTAITHGYSWAHVGGPRSSKRKYTPKRKKAA